MKIPKAKREGTRVILPCRLSYAHLDAPWGNAEGEKKYQTVAIIDDEDTVKTVREAIQQARNEGIAKLWKGEAPRKMQLPLKSGDEEYPDDPVYAGKWYFSAKSRTPVPCLNALKQPIDPVECYSGCYCMVSVNFYAYDAAGGKGVAAGLNAVLKHTEGERLGGDRDGSKDFDDLDFGLDEGLDDL